MQNELRLIRDGVKRQMGDLFDCQNRKRRSLHCRAARGVYQSCCRLLPNHSLQPFAQDSKYLCPRSTIVVGRPKLVVDACNKLLSIYTKDEFGSGENEAALFSRPPTMDKATVPQRWVGTTEGPCGSFLATGASVLIRFIAA